MIVCLPRRVNRFFAVLVTAIIVSFPGCSVAPVAAQPASAQINEARPLADVLEDVTPAVVNIAVRSGSPAESNPLYSDPFFRRFFDTPEMLSRPRMSMPASSASELARPVRGERERLLSRFCAVERGSSL
jgi:S1-C subfamily serine protease